MISVLLFFAKAKSFIAGIFSFILTHWRVFLALAILAYTYYAFNALRGERDSARGELKDFKSQIERETIQREAENKIKAELGKIQVKNITEKHQQELTAILQKEKGLKNEIAINKRDIANYRDSLRTTIESYQSAGLPKNDTDRFAEGNDNTALFRELQQELNTCQEAGVVAALDYNLCKNYVDNEQLRLGVEND